MKRSELKEQLTALVAELIPTIDDEYRSREQDLDDDTPAMDLTVGCDGETWSYQTGDNSFTGGAYGHADWAVTTLTRDSDPARVAEGLIDDFLDLETDWEFEEETDSHA